MFADTQTAGKLGSLVLLVLAIASPAGADVVHVSPGGFTTRTAVTVAAPPDRVYKALTEVGSWWSSEHTYSGDAKNLSMAAQAGGCFCERLPNGGGIEHARVTYAAPGQLLRLHGGLGPLHEMAVQGVLTWEIAPAQDGAGVTLTYAAGGYTSGSFEQLAPLVDKVLAEQLHRLEAHLAGK